MNYLKAFSVLVVVLVMPHYIMVAADTISNHVDHDNKKVIDCEEENKDLTETDTVHKCLMMFQVGKSLLSKKSAEVPYRRAATISRSASWHVL